MKTTWDLLPVEDLAEDRARPIDLSIVLPTFQERENVPHVIAQLKAALTGLQWEAIFVDDDSPDGTAEVVRAFARKDDRIRILHRIGRRGLSSACIEGALASSADWVAVMDADLQHDERILPVMLERAREGALDVVVGTRNAEGGSMGQFSKERILLSSLGKKVSHIVSRSALSDPMSGFFLARRSFIVQCAPRVQGGGFKILVDLFASSRREVRFAEVGYTFRERELGASKLDVKTALEYLGLVINKLTGGLVSAQFILFGAVGTIGVMTHLVFLTVLRRFGVEFFPAEIVATYVAMTENFFLNNAFTYRDRMLRGRRLFLGLASYYGLCTFGAWASVVFARALVQQGTTWLPAGALGILLSSVWNYSMSNLFTWQRPGRS